MTKHYKSFKIIAIAAMLFLGLAIINEGCNKSKILNQIEQKKIIESISAEQAFSLIQENSENKNFIIIDIRTPNEYAEGHIKNSIIMNYYSETFSDELNKLDKNKVYLIYCRTGGLSGKALSEMAESGFRAVYGVSGGITQWIEKGYPTEQ